jgi:hypothetical protein
VHRDSRVVNVHCDSRVVNVHRDSRVVNGEQFDKPCTNSSNGNSNNMKFTGDDCRIYRQKSVYIQRTPGAFRTFTQGDYTNRLIKYPKMSIKICLSDVDYQRKTPHRIITMSVTHKPYYDGA